MTLAAHQGEGWFPLAPAGGLRCTVVGTVDRKNASDPFYVVRIEQPLEVQEPATDTPSRLRSHFYNHAVICSRQGRVGVGSEPGNSVFVLLPPPELPLPTTKDACVSLPIRAWAACRVGPQSIK